jgi:hypothetical protein
MCSPSRERRRVFRALFPQASARATMATAHSGSARDRHRMLSSMAPSALSHGDGAPGAGAAHCPMGTVPRVLVRRTASPAHADFGGLSSGAAPVVVQLDVVPLPPRSSAPTVAGCRLGGYPVGRDRWGGKRAAGGMYPAFTLAPTCGANRAS